MNRKSEQLDLCSDFSLVMMVKSTNFREYDYITKFFGLNRPRNRAIHIKREVSTIIVIIAEVIGQKPLQIAFTQDYQMIQTFTTYRPNKPFDIWRLPGTSGIDFRLFYNHVFDTILKIWTINFVSIPRNIPWCRIPREGFYDSLSSPFCSRVLCNVKTNHTVTIIGQNQKGVKRRTVFLKVGTTG